MAEEEHAYYLGRARKALELSEQAADMAIANIHLEMYDLYMARADEYGLYVRHPSRTATDRS